MNTTISDLHAFILKEREWYLEKIRKMHERWARLVGDNDELRAKNRELEFINDLFQSDEELSTLQKRLAEALVEKVYGEDVEGLRNRIATVLRQNAVKEA